MSQSLHPKTAGAAIGGSLGLLIVAILNSIHGVHLTPEAYAAIPNFLAILGAWIIPEPAPGVTDVTGNFVDPLRPPQ